MSDLGIKKVDIPAVLASAKEQPYQLPAAHGCAAIALEIRRLDEALGRWFAPAGTGEAPSVVVDGKAA